jgi:hypothetical protein
VELEIAPWNGAPYHKHEPASPMRALTCGPAGQGDIVHLILDDLRRVAGRQWQPAFCCARWR